MAYETIIYDVSESILTLTLNRPEKLNAFTNQMLTELIDALDRADADDDVRVIIVTGSGRAFCAGADLSSGGRTFDYVARAQRQEVADGPIAADGSVNWSHPSVRDGGGKLSLRLYSCLKPLIAACNGPAVGVGATMQLPMDVRLASENARFGFVFTRRGMVPEACSSWFLPRVVGISQALEWVTTGRVFSAQEALEARLVKRLYKPDELLPAARALAREMIEGTSPVSVALSRQMLWRMLGADHPMMAHRIDSRGIFSRGLSGDSREGVTSFLEKRPANFPGKVSTGLPAYFPWWDEPPYE